MIDAIQPTVSVKDNTFDELRSENKKERFELFAEEFKSRFGDDKNSDNSVEAKAKAKDENNSSSKKAEQNKIKTDLQDMSEKLKEIIEDTNVFLEFKIDKDTNQMVLRLIDNETKEVVQQYPTELALKIARIISQISGSGSIANAKV